MTNELNKSPHWSEDDLIARLYGLDGTPGVAESHLAECAECSERWSTMQRQRAGLAAGWVPVSADRLRAQRQGVWARIDQPRRAAIWRAMPAAATVMMLFLGVALHRSSAPVTEPRQVAALSSLSDEQLINEIASVVDQDTPRAADPIRGLFSEEAKVEAQ